MNKHRVAEPTRVLQSGLSPRSRCYAIAACVAALAFGVLLPSAPWPAVAGLVVIPLAFAAPVGALGLLIAAAVLVPFEVQQALSVTGGHGQPGLLIVDVLMLLGLVRIGWLIARRRLQVDLPLLLGIVLSAVCTAGVVWGIANGADVSVAGAEARCVMLGVVTFTLAWPLLKNQAARSRLVRILIGIGLALGLWGLTQWMFPGSFTWADTGVRLNALTSRQLQGGMYAYPVAVVLAWVALVAGQVRTAAVKCLFVVILFLNASCVFLTFERTLWAATAAACILVVVTSGARAFGHAFRWAAIGMAFLALAAIIAPAEASTALERLSSVGQLQSDNSLKWRVVETQILAEHIRAQPFTGYGFGSTITWGVRDTFATMTTSYSHNAYFWLAWKIGIPAAAIFVVVIGRAALRRLPKDDTGEWRTFRKGSRVSLLALFLICITFPLFNSMTITPLIGLLTAVCYSWADSPAVPRPVRSRGTQPHSLSTPVWAPIERPG